MTVFGRTETSPSHPEVDAHLCASACYTRRDPIRSAREAVTVLALDLTGPEAYKRLASIATAHGISDAARVILENGWRRHEELYRKGGGRRPTQAEKESYLLLAEPCNPSADPGQQDKRDM